jgi:hypothetical protein
MRWETPCGFSKIPSRARCINVRPLPTTPARTARVSHKKRVGSRTTGSACGRQLSLRRDGRSHLLRTSQLSLLWPVYPNPDRRVKELLDENTYTNYFSPIKFSFTSI